MLLLINKYVNQHQCNIDGICDFPPKINEVMHFYSHSKCNVSPGRLANNAFRSFKPISKVAEWSETLYFHCFGWTYHPYVKSDELNEIGAVTQEKMETCSEKEVETYFNFFRFRKHIFSKK